MSKIKRVAFIGNSLPRRCGIATFTTDLYHSIAKAFSDVTYSVVAMSDTGHTYEYPEYVGHHIRAEVLGDYRRVADELNAARFDVVSLQHEFGIFGGEAGEFILALLTRLRMPVVTTLHTVLSAPSATQRMVMQKIISLSEKVIVMAQKGRDLLRTLYGVPPEKIVVLPHGIPDVEFTESAVGKLKHGFQDRSVILTFGLLSPNKGIDVMIDAMPSILKSRPDAVYVVLGATHPNLIREQGEVYRAGLIAQAERLGVADHVVFIDKFVDQETLLSFISMCDVYVTPYLSEAQMTSGTLAYSFGLGKAVVSTPYWHASELLADGRGLLVPFGNAAALGQEVGDLLNDDKRRLFMRRRAYQTSRSMTWAQTALRVMNIFQSAVSGHHLLPLPSQGQRVSMSNGYRAPELRLGHLFALCDDTGLFQHARHAIPDRSHGYCIDDNARALLLTVALNSGGAWHLPESFSARFAAFLEFGWNPKTGRFRNFMSFERQWLDEAGSEDCHGRALWALGQCAYGDPGLARRQWASALFREAYPAVEEFTSPRAFAFTLLGLDGYCRQCPKDTGAALLRLALAERLMSALITVESANWHWFENELAYDNTRLCEALIVTGITLGVWAYIDAGLRSLRWIMSVQTGESGCFRPVGTTSFGQHRSPPQVFDQQPLEATAAVAACLAALRATGDGEWRFQAYRAFDWFTGGNDLSVSLIDPETGSCCDGLHPDRANANRGGESAVSYLLALGDIRALTRLGHQRPAFVPRIA